MKPLPALITAALSCVAAVALGQSCGPWEIVPSPTTANLNGVAWNGSRYVAVGAGGTILTSENGLDWQQEVSGTSLSVNGVVWGDRFVAVADTGYTLTSPDGVAWVLRTQLYPSSQNVLGVTWDGTNYHAVTSLGACWITADGLTNFQSFWVADLYSVRGIAWNSTSFVATDDDGKVAISPNGRDWTRVTNRSGTALNAAHWTGTSFLAAGEGQAILRSPDGATWTTVHTPVGWQQLEGLAQHGDHIVAVGWGGLALVSDDDGATWQPELAPTPKHFYGVAYGDGQLIAVGSGGLIARSVCPPPPPPTPTPTPPPPPQPCPVIRHLRGTTP